MSEFRVGEDGAAIVHADGDPVVWLAPGTRIVGQLMIDVEPHKMRRVRSDKQRRAGRDYETPEMAAHEDKQA